MKCLAGAKLHDNMAISLLKWMKNNSTNREVLRITSKEILSLEISDDNSVRQTCQKYLNELLEMPTDLKTEKNLKSFDEKMKGNNPADIQFSSVAPANGVDGEIDAEEIENETQSEADSSTNRNDDDADENSDVSVSNDANAKQSDSRSESSDSAEQAVESQKKATKLTSKIQSEAAASSKSMATTSKKHANKDASYSTSNEVRFWNTELGFFLTNIRT